MSAAQDSSNSPEVILDAASRLTVVGLSTDPSKPSHHVPIDLRDHGWDVRGVHPTATNIVGIPVVSKLSDVTGGVGLVVVFRPSAEAEEVTRAAIEAGATGVWLQSGITSLAARVLAEAAGIDFVEDECMFVVRGQAGLDHR